MRKGVANTSKASPIRSFIHESKDGDVSKIILVTGSSICSRKSDPALLSIPSIFGEMLEYNINNFVSRSCPIGFHAAERSCGNS